MESMTTAKADLQTDTNELQNVLTFLLELLSSIRLALVKTGDEFVDDVLKGFVRSGRQQKQSKHR